MRQRKALAFSGLGLAASLLTLFSLVVKILSPLFLFIVAALYIGFAVLSIQILRDKGLFRKGRTSLLIVLPILVLVVLMGSGAIYYAISH